MTPLRVKHLVGYGLEVPDVAVAAHFYSSFGLRASMDGDVLEMRSHDGDEPEIIVVKGREKRLHHLSFAIDPATLERFAEHLVGLGTPPAAPPFGALRAGLWFQDPWGLWLNLVPVPGRSAQSVLAVPQDPRVDRHLWQELNRQVKPNRLGHLLMFANEWEKTEMYYAEALGLRTSDRAAGKVSFMSGGVGVRDHHCFGLIRSTHRGFQHASFHVDSIDDIGFGALQMHKAGYTEGFGVGRHAIASNLFHYTRDPWGSWVEYYTDMDKISEAWVTRDWNDLPYIWPAWAPEFWGKEMNGNFEPI